MTARFGVIGGYLGSGKSTLVNRLLAAALPGRTAVVVNDFGSINIDAELVASVSEEVIELSNGCICCQISDDLQRTLSALAERGSLDQVLCEVSGVGDPRQLAGWQTYPGFSPGPVVVCADATAISRLLRDQYVGDVVERQLRGAGVILVTQTDLVSASEIKDVVSRCRAVAPSARVVTQDAQGPAATASVVLTDERDSLVVDPRSSAVADHAGAHRTRTVEFSDTVDVDLLAETLRDHADLLMRAKGLVRRASGRWWELQLASGRVDVRARSLDQSAPRSSGVVLIAAGPNAEEVLATVARRIRIADHSATIEP